MTITAYDSWKTDAALDDEVHEHDEHCDDDCSLLTSEDYAELAAERRAEEAADDYARGDW